MKPAADRTRCLYTSSHDGVSRCADEVHAQRFCRFHYQCLLVGEISREGYLADTLSDQVRRREINYHGVQFEGVLVGPGSHGA